MDTSLIVIRLTHSVKLEFFRYEMKRGFSDPSQNKVMVLCVFPGGTMFYSRSTLSRPGLLREGSHGLSHSFPGVFREIKIREADEQNNAKLSKT